ncbi:hypothetical protein [Microbacterium elymi]|uniref:4Fe-4S ferredoxin-type domain-containing protein n=1 Tax=Microbacterium elymi TaxID=2909587 RepID=A0ABY5NLI1_9MICO|nr:hypothetical protein [Microbacterium elymi]UUT36042.1 hypothetical protein L2X98_23360 [Microbacterium elymi]
MRMTAMIGRRRSAAVIRARAEGGRTPIDAVRGEGYPEPQADILPAVPEEGGYRMDAMMMGAMSKDMMSMPGMPAMDMAMMQECMDACSACEQACTVCSMQADGLRPGMYELRRHVQHHDARDDADAGHDAGGDDGDARRVRGDVSDVHGRVHGARRPQ